MDYKKLGMKAGLEIHQQLDTHKLFCECGSQISKEDPDIKIKRELRPLAGETGKIDPAALFERKKRKFYLYEAYTKTTCLVELDEEPPHPINQEALDTTLLIAKMLNCEIPNILQVMRKTVVDGSNTSGFQRTVLVGINGFIDTNFGKVGITNISLEEDAARRITEDEDSVTFRLDRLGIAMIEIGTAPDCHTPEQVKELAEKLGLLLRATGKVKRGLGTIRQDVNVSIKDGARNEIKGFQELRQMPKVVEHEVKRQLKLIEAKKKVEKEVRNALPDGTTKFLRPLPGAARMYPETDIPLIKISKERIEKLRIPELLEEKLERFTKLGLSEDLAKQMIRYPKIDFFERLIKKFIRLKPNLIANTLLSIKYEVKQKTKKEYEFSEEEYENVFDLLNKDRIAKESILDIFIGLSEGKTIQDLEKEYAKLSDAELEREIAKLKKEFKDNKKKIIGALRGKADIKKILELING